MDADGSSGRHAAGAAGSDAARTARPNAAAKYSGATRCSASAAIFADSSWTAGRPSATWPDGDATTDADYYRGRWCGAYATASA